jgi:hypothetical protein
MAAAPTRVKKVIPAQTPVTVSPSELAASTDIPDPVGYQEIAALAYEYWQARGCPDGSPEEDWFRAESELQSRS